MSEVSATPILDLEQAPPKARRSLSAIALGVAIGCGVIIVPILQDQGVLPAWQLPDVNTWLFLPMIYVAIAVHELGHAVVAKMAGIDTGGISVGPAIWHKSGDRWVFRWEWRRWGGGFFKPLTAEIGLDPAPFAWSVAGGPLASLVLTLIFALLWMRLGAGAGLWISTMFEMSLLSLVLVLIPFSSGVSKSDGARLWQFLRHPGQARQVMALLGVQTEEAHGLRPREWNARLFEAMMQEERGATEYVWCDLMACFRAMDEGADEESLVHLEKALACSARSGAPMRHVLFQQAAFSSARIRKNAASAREWLKRSSALRKPRSTAAVDGAIAMCEGRYADALEHLAAARAYVDKLKLDSGLVRFSKSKWAEMEEECVGMSADAAGKSARATTSNAVE